MKIIRHYHERCTLQEFAEKHNMTMEFFERSVGTTLPSLYGHLSHVEVKDGCMLVGAYGNGYTEAQVIRDYAKQLSGKLIVWRAMHPDRKQIQCPVFIEEGTDHTP
jgi:hypothetical protein